MKNLDKKVYEIRKAGNFRNEILFNGASAGSDLFTNEEKNYLSQRFKAFVNENVLASMNEEVEFILNCENRYNNVPFSWDDVENLYNYNIERIKEDKIKMEYIDNEYPALKQHARDTYAGIEKASPCFIRLEQQFKSELAGVMDGVWDE